MGERLGIKVHAFGEDVAAIYYHWSAFTVSALCEVRDIIQHEELFESDNKGDFLYRLIRVLEINGGGIDGGKGSDEWNKIVEKYKRNDFKENPNRNNGLIAVSNEGMEDLESWAAQELLMDFDNEVVYGGAFYEYSSIYEMNQDLKEDEINPVKEEEIYTSKINPAHINFDEIENAIQEFDRRDFVKHDGRFYSFIR